ncbi:MAG: response regulator transcription factor [Solirubrobacterales bacterium]|nr:response regulator transcription factor [Solirubrobacterales bacterium]
MTPPVRVLLAEPDEPTRVGIHFALQADGFEICCEPLDAASAADDARRERPLVCLIDEHLPGGALVAVDAIYRSLPGAKLLVLTDAEDPKHLFAAIRAGASGYLRKDLDPTRFPATIYGVLDGEAALSRRLTMQLIETLRTRERGRSAPTTPGGPSMTDRELEVLELMTEGLRTSEIAARLSVAEVTVRRHISSAVSKLGVADRAAAIAVLSGRSRV